MILRPSKNFTIVRQIANHLDTATYYVRAVIRDAYTDETLATLNLDDKGGQRFTKNWQVSPDPSGLGREISIVTSVYTDSGYTTKSENYGDEENSHLIEENIQRGGGGGGVDYYTVRKIIREELEKLPKPEPFPEIPVPQVNVRLDSVLSAIENVLSAIEEMKVVLKPEKPQKPEKINLVPVLDAIATLKESFDKSIKNIEIPEPADLQPILDKIDQREGENETTKKEIVILLNVIATFLQSINKPTVSKKETPLDISKIAL